jgi:hypothetical protein
LINESHALLAAGKIDEERQFVLDDRPAEIRLQIFRVRSRHGEIRRRLERIARIEQMIAVGKIHRSVKISSARLGQNFDAAAAGGVVLGRKRIRVDADLANRFLGRKLAVGKSRR